MYFANFVDIALLYHFFIKYEINCTPPSIYLHVLIIIKKRKDIF